MSETKMDMMLNGICMVCENKDTLCTHIGQVKEECPFIQKAISTKITNADRIRSMTDEELAKFLNMVAEESMETINGYGTKDYTSIWEKEKTALEWLQSEAE